jgi:flagellar assembly protein FliH
MLSDYHRSTTPAATSVAAYVYPVPLAPGLDNKPNPNGGNNSTLEHLWAPEVKQTVPPPITEEQVRRREAQARKQGQDQGFREAAAEFEKKLSTDKLAFVQAIRQFAVERQSYFERVEAELVQLALAIARKILHREAQVDPLLLAGVVRVAIGKIASGTHVRLRVHPDQVAGWHQFFSQQAEGQSAPEMLGDPALEPGHCVLETELGSTDLTLETQLKEIEQGFFDLLAQRPSK